MKITKDQLLKLLTDPDGSPLTYGDGTKYKFASDSRYQLVSVHAQKKIEWSYPTSPNADRFKFRFGCYSVETVEGNNPGVAIAGFATIEDAENFALALPFSWNIYSKRAPILVRISSTLHGKQMR